MTDPMNFLFGSGAKSATFDSIGVTVGGPITEAPTMQQQKDLDTGELKTWQDGNPMMQLVVTVQTTLREPGNLEDEGIRRFYIRGNMQKAVAAGVRAAGASSLEVGGVLAITYTGDGVASKRGFNAPKLYSATYKPPAAEFLNQAAAQPGPWDNGAQQHPAPPVQPVQQQAAPQPAPLPTDNPLAGLSPEALAALAQLQNNQQ